MHTSVPQYIDVEDKIAFGLTGRQLLWMGGMLATLVALYSLFERQLFYAIGFFVIIIFGAFAFWRPQGVSLISFLGFFFQYFLKPRSYIWKRVYSGSGVDAQKAPLVERQDIGQAPRKKNIPRGRELSRMAWLLDTEGKIRNP